MSQILTKAERRGKKSATRQYKRALKKGLITKEKTPEIKLPTTVKRDRKTIGKAMMTLNQMVNGQMITGNLSVERGGEIVENTFTRPYRSKSVEVFPPYSQRVFDSLGGAPQGGVCFFDKHNRKKSW